MWIKDAVLYVDKGCGPLCGGGSSGEGGRQVERQRRIIEGLREEVQVRACVRACVCVCARACARVVCGVAWGFRLRLCTPLCS
jgi:hypothetical protein